MIKEQTADCVEAVEIVYFGSWQADTLGLLISRSTRTFQLIYFRAS